MGSGASRHDSSLEIDEQQSPSTLKDDQTDSVTLRVTTTFRQPKLNEELLNSESIEASRLNQNIRNSVDDSPDFFEEENNYHPNEEEEFEEEVDPEGIARAEMFSQTAMSLDMDNDEFLFNLLYFTGGDASQLHFGNMMNNAMEETVALHSETGLHYKLKPASETALSYLQPETMSNNLRLKLIDSDSLEDQSEEPECSVCRDVLEEGCEIVRLPLCGHVFHSDCILKWLKLQGWCPFCRAEILAPSTSLDDCCLPPSVSSSASSSSISSQSPRPLKLSPRPPRTISVQSLPPNVLSLDNDSCTHTHPHPSLCSQSISQCIIDQQLALQQQPPLYPTPPSSNPEGELKTLVLSTFVHSQPQAAISATPNSSNLGTHVCSFDLSAEALTAPPTSFPSLESTPLPTSNSSPSSPRPLSHPLVPLLSISNSSSPSTSLSPSPSPRSTPRSLSSHIAHKLVLTMMTSAIQHK